jgi:hypothetical protein
MTEQSTALPYRHHPRDWGGASAATHSATVDSRGEEWPLLGSGNQWLWRSQGGATPASVRPSALGATYEQAPNSHRNQNTTGAGQPPRPCGDKLQAQNSTRPTTADADGSHAFKHTCEYVTEDGCNRPAPLSPSSGVESALSPCAEPNTATCSLRRPSNTPLSHEGARHVGVDTVRPAVARRRARRPLGFGLWGGSSIEAMPDITGRNRWCGREGSNLHSLSGTSS